jgi:hypothetical protein
MGVTVVKYAEMKVEVHTWQTKLNKEATAEHYVKALVQLASDKLRL